MIAMNLIQLSLALWNYCSVKKQEVPSIDCQDFVAQSCSFLRVFMQGMFCFFAATSGFEMLNFFLQIFEWLK